MRVYKVFFISFMLISFTFPAQAGVVTPIEFVRNNGNQIIKILKNKDLSHDEKINQLITIAEKIFYFQEMAKRTLAIHWRKRTPEEKKEFIQVYKEFLKKTYAQKINKYSGEKVEYTGESVKSNYAVVKTKVLNDKKDIETPVDYKLKVHKDQWKVYDIVVEGISLINNYRTQFNEIINSSSYDGLIQKLNDKINEETKIIS